MEYSEIQTNEVEALRAIYMEDFVEEEQPHTAAWNRSPSPKFRISFRPSSEYEESAISLEISVTMTATYPKTLPTISIVRSNALHPKQLEVLRKSISETTLSLIGSEMIFEVTSNLQALVDDYARIEEEAPSLEQARLQRLQLAEEQQSRELEQRRQELEDSQRRQTQQLERLVLEELDEQENQEPIDAETSIVLLPEDPGRITFDRPVIARRSNGSPVRFQQVSIGFNMDVNFFGTSQVVKPILPSGNGHEEEMLCVFTEVSLTEPFWDSAEGRKQLHDLESELEIVKEFRHPNVLALYEFQIARPSANSGWKVWLLSQYGNIGTVADLLDTVETVDLNVTRSWSIQILEGLEVLHKSGLIHKMICLDNIVINRKRDTGESSVLLAHPSYLHRFVEMNNMHAFSSFGKTTMSSQGRWQPPEMNAVKAINPTRKSDIWQFGVILVQMLVGKNVVNGFKDPLNFVRGKDWPQSLSSFLVNIFSRSTKSRPSAFDLLMAQFLRSTDDISLSSSRALSFSRPRANSEYERQSGVYSRYINDFDEAVVLGRGGFGQVVKARNKLDGRVYAVKKIQATSSTLSFILQEVVLLSRLNHSNVVRYYTVWLEEDHLALPQSSIEDVSETTSGAVSKDPSGSSTPKFTVSLSDLDLFGSSHDLMSGSQYSFVQFANSSDDDNDAAIESESSEDETDEEGHGNFSFQSTSEPSKSSRDKSKRGVKPLIRVPKPALRSTLYIQMEYCENHTLADLIKDNLYKQPVEYWRLFRQIVEALAYIHQDGIIHRDLKPKNIFIDEARNIKIGDFGLARSVVQTTITAQGAAAIESADGEDLTTGVGTSLYVAVEINSTQGKGTYNEKVDMYSLGIIFFEMVYPVATEMERANTIRRLRLPSIDLPGKFSGKRYTNERDIVVSLLNHDPNSRPSATSILKSGKIPSSTEDLTIKEALNTLVGTNSKSVRQVCNALFSQPLVSAQQVLYDRSSSLSKAAAKTGSPPTMADTLLENELEERLRKLFRLHGAVEDTSFRSKIFPKSALYKTPTVVELLDHAGNVLQLPHDLTVPYARRLAEFIPEYSKSFSLSHVYRSDPSNVGHHPVVRYEVDFDIVGPEASVETLYNDAETIKMMVDAVAEFKCLDENGLCVYLNHSDILLTILDYAGFTPPQHHAALSLLGEEGISPAKQSVKRDLLGRSTLSATSLDMLERLGFREAIGNAEHKMGKLIDDKSGKIQAATLYLRAVSDLVKKYGVTIPIYFAPLSNHQPKFYESGIMFQLVHESGTKRNILAAGGRYDKLIKSFRHSVLDSRTPVARGVGFNMALNRFLEFASAIPKAKLAESGVLRARCSVLVTSFHDANIQGMSLDLLRTLWGNGISADLAKNVVSSEEVVKLAERDNIDYVVVVKQVHTLALSNKMFKPLRVKKISAKIDLDMTVDELVTFILAEKNDNARANRASTSVLMEPDAKPETTRAESPVPMPDESSRIVVLNESGKMKGGRKNRWLLEEKSKESVHGFLADLAAAPIISLDLRDEIIQAITTVSPHNPEEWKRKVAGLAPHQKAYILTVQGKLSTEAQRCSRLMLFSSKTENVFVYNVDNF